MQGVTVVRSTASHQEGHRLNLCYTAMTKMKTIRNVLLG